MGLLRALFGRRQRRFTAEDIKELKGLFEEQNAKKAKQGSFIEQYKQFKTIEQEMAEQREDEIQAIIDRYAPARHNDDDDDGDPFEQMVVQQILPKVFPMNQATSIKEVPTPNNTEQEFYTNRKNDILPNKSR